MPERLPLEATHPGNRKAPPPKARLLSLRSFHLEEAALFAISARRSGVMLAARAGPRFLPIADAAELAPRSSG